MKKRFVIAVAAVLAIGVAAGGYWGWQQWVTNKKPEVKTSALESLIAQDLRKRACGVHREIAQAVMFARQKGVPQEAALELLNNSTEIPEDQHGTVRDVIKLAYVMPQAELESTRKEVSVEYGALIFSNCINTAKQ